MEEMYGMLMALTGREIALKLVDDAAISGKLLGVERQPWGFILHLSSRLGDHYVAYPGQVLQLLIPRME